MYCSYHTRSARDALSRNSLLRAAPHRLTYALRLVAKVDMESGVNKSTTISLQRSGFLFVLQVCSRDGQIADDHNDQDC